MRIISGKYRGKKLKEFELDSTKPTLDRVKESIFNLVQFDVLNSVVLDLFSGTGALGIEAISRGAKKTYLIDSNPRAIKLIQENLKGIDGCFEVCQTDFLKFLLATNEKFDLVFLDPPYRTNCGIEAIKVLTEKDLISDNGIIIFETADELSFDFNLPNYEINKRKYGTVAVYKLTKR